MKGIIKLLLAFVLIIKFVTPASADDELGGCDVDRDYKIVESRCNAGAYADRYQVFGTFPPAYQCKCVSCDTRFPKSIYGENMTAEDCYEECPAGTIDHGTYDKHISKYDSWKSTACPDLVVAKVHCDTDYHVEIDKDNHNIQSCVSNTRECTPAGCSKGSQTWNYSINDWNDCICSACDTNHFLREGECILMTAGENCSLFFDACTNGSVQGQISTTGTTNNFEQCRCKLTNQSLDRGTGDKFCKLSKKCDTNSSNCYKWDCANFEYTYTSCNAGYCEPGADCRDAQPGEFSLGGTGACTKCPQGSTSYKGAKAAKDCFYNNQTQFCDSNGCFKLPIGEIHYSTGE